MQLSYDPEADAVYVRLTDKEPCQVRVDENGLIADYATDGSMVGFELLSLRTRPVELQVLPPAAVPGIQQLIQSGSIERGIAFHLEW